MQTHEFATAVILYFVANSRIYIRCDSEMIGLEGLTMNIKNT